MLIYLLFSWLMANFRLLLTSSFTHSILIIAFGPEGNPEPRNKVRSLSPFECSVEFEPITFLSDHNSSTHLATSPKLWKYSLQICTQFFQNVEMSQIAKNGIAWSWGGF